MPCVKCSAGMGQIITFIRMAGTPVNDKVIISVLTGRFPGVLNRAYWFRDIGSPSLRLPQHKIREL
jgi:hypothetical protein